ncbi:MAG: dihydroorotate dehydrogenase electron transfer subunit [Coriobacteriales bacterium]
MSEGEGAMGKASEGALTGAGAEGSGNTCAGENAGTGGDGSRVPLVDEEVTIVSNDKIAPSIYLMVLEAPQIAAGLLPGQFVHLRVPDFCGHVLRRPFSVCSWNTGTGEIQIMYQVVGSGTEALSTVKPGTPTRAIGPVGRGWEVPDGTGRALLVCGGIGVAPLMMLASEMCAEGIAVDVLLGATTADRLLGEEALTSVGAEVHTCTDDGSAGYHGFCTDLMDDYTACADYVAICGPAPMERIAVGKALESENCRCEVSLERRMACGIGACLSCVVDTVDGKKRACIDGPVFDARKVVWR